MRKLTDEEWALLKPEPKDPEPPSYDPDEVTRWRGIDAVVAAPVGAAAAGASMEIWLGGSALRAVIFALLMAASGSIVASVFDLVGRWVARTRAHWDEQSAHGNAFALFAGILVTSYLVARTTSAPPSPRIWLAAIGSGAAAALAGAVAAPFGRGMAIAFGRKVGLGVSLFVALVSSAFAAFYSFGVIAGGGGRTSSMSTAGQAFRDFDHPLSPETLFVIVCIATAIGAAFSACVSVWREPL